MRFNFQESKQKSTDEHTENLKSTNRKKFAKSLFFSKNFKNREFQKLGMGKAFEHATVWSGVAEIFFGKYFIGPESGRHPSSV